MEDIGKELTPEFIIKEHIRRIARITANFGKSTKQAVGNYHASVNFLADCLDFWIPFFPNLETEKKEFDARIKKKKEDDPEFNIKDYDIVRERFRFYIRLLNQMGLFLRAEVRGT
jgi:hypothetical protein